MNFFKNSLTFDRTNCPRSRYQFAELIMWFGEIARCGWSASGCGEYEPAVVLHEGGMVATTFILLHEYHLQVHDEKGLGGGGEVVGAKGVRARPGGPVVRLVCCEPRAGQEQRGNGTWDTPCSPGAVPQSPRTLQNPWSPPCPQCSPVCHLFVLLGLGYLHTALID